MSHLRCFATLVFAQGLMAFGTNTPLDLTALAWITVTLAIHKAGFSTE